MKISHLHVKDKADIEIKTGYGFWPFHAKILWKKDVAT